VVTATTCDEDVGSDVGATVSDEAADLAPGFRFSAAARGV